MSTLFVTRSFNVRRVQVWRVEAPEGFDLATYDDTSVFDEHVCAQGELVTESHEFLDDNEEFRCEVIAVDGRVVE